MKLELRDITLDDFARCLDISVLPEQRDFTPSTMFFLAEAKVNPMLVPLAIYFENTMIGFVMLGDVDKDKQVAYLSALIIDAPYQRKGYGRAAVLEVARWLAIKTDCYGLWSSFASTNTAAEALCRSTDFRITDQRYYQETVVFLSIAPYRSQTPLFIP